MNHNTFTCFSSPLLLFLLLSSSLLLLQPASCVKDGLLRFVDIHQTSDLDTVDNVVVMLKNRCIDGVYLNSADLLSNTADSLPFYSCFINTLRANGLKVYLTVGNSEFSVPCAQATSKLCMEDGWKAYRDVVALDITFDGIYDQTEAIYTSLFEDAPLRIKWLYDYLSTAKQIIANSSKPLLELWATAPSWLDKRTETSCIDMLGLTCQPASLYMCKLSGVNGCAITGVPSLNDPTKLADALKYEGATFPTSMVVYTTFASANDTTDVTSSTYYDEGQCYMESMFSWLARNSSINLTGVSIRYLEYSYKDMPANGDCLPLKCDGTPTPTVSSTTVCSQVVTARPRSSSTTRARSATSKTTGSGHYSSSGTQALANFLLFSEVLVSEALF